MEIDILEQLNDIKKNKIDNDGSLDPLISEFIINKTLSLLENITHTFGYVFPIGKDHIVIECRKKHKEIHLIIQKHSVSLYYQINNQYGMLYNVTNKDIEIWLEWFKKC